MRVKTSAMSSVPVLAGFGLPALGYSRYLRNGQNRLTVQQTFRIQVRTTNRSIGTLSQSAASFRSLKMCTWIGEPWVSKACNRA